MSMTGIGEVADLIKTGLNKFLPDPGQLEQAANTLAGQVFDFIKTEMQAQRDIIVAEAQSGSWLTQNWRPLVMLQLMGLVTAYWFGFTAPNLPADQVMTLLEMVKIGLSGYVVGRSVEKVASSIAPAIHSALKK